MPLIMNIEFFILILVILNFQVHFAAIWKFTKIECTEFDTTFSNVEECNLKVVGRNRVAVNVFVRLNELPVNNVTLNAQLLKKENGYRPFLYNSTLNFCEFVRNPYRQPFWKIILDAIYKGANVSYKCPINTHIAVRKFIFRSDLLKLIPLPGGEYMIRLNFGAYNVYRAEGMLANEAIRLVVELLNGSKLKNFVH